MSLYPLPEYQRRSDFDCGTEQITKQSFADECDIHKILKQYQQTGIVSHITPNQPRYLDLPSDLDYQSSLNIIMEAQDAFNTLPSAVRERFGNNPERFLEALADPEQREYLESVGVFEPKKPVPGPMKVEIVNPVPPQGAEKPPGGQSPSSAT